MNNDCISRIGAKRYLYDQIDILSDTDYAVFSDFIDSMYNDLPAIDSNSLWIPIEEALPEDDTIVLVSYAMGSPGISSYHKDTKYNNGFDCPRYGLTENGSQYIIEVIAWMPLPEPYRG